MLFVFVVDDVPVSLDSRRRYVPPELAAGHPDPRRNLVEGIGGSRERLDRAGLDR